MIPTMLLLFACTLMYAGGPVTRFEFILFSLAAGGAVLVAICWGAVEELIERAHDRNWPAASATIEIVSVAFIKDDFPSLKADLDDSHYLATLTYFYNDPERQTGNYSRRFADKDEAQTWASSYKGETVTVHVDPRDPMRSLLRKEDL
jgi:hypothetical protein